VQFFSFLNDFLAFLKQFLNKTARPGGMPVVVAEGGQRICPNIQHGVAE